MKFRAFILPIMLPLPATGVGHASSSEWFEMEGARVRLVTTGTPDAEGRLKGLLHIDLDPGWKTYWRDPGDSGVPPSVAVDSADVELDFPAPQRHDEGDFQWAGYDYPVGFPVTFAFKDLAGARAIEADVFLGVCETVCVPLQAKLSVDPAADPDNADDAAAVKAAFDNVPGPARADFGVKVISDPGAKTLRLEAAFPGDPTTAQLFLASENGYTFATPERHSENGKTVFTTEILSLPARLGTGKGLPYTLVTNAGAVNGHLPYF
jgi:DsbC/DsbD-like thiol-disulfide interchange protein